MESETQLIANQSCVCRMRGSARRSTTSALMLNGAIAAQGQVGLMLNVRKAESGCGAASAAGAEFADGLARCSDAEWVAVNTMLEESVVRDVIPQAEGCGRYRDRGVSAEQGCHLMRDDVGSGEAHGTADSQRPRRKKIERLLQALERRGAHESGSRGAGGAAHCGQMCGEAAIARCWRLRAQLDGVSRKQPLRISPGEMQRAWEETVRSCRRR